MRRVSGWCNADSELTQLFQIFRRQHGIEGAWQRLRIVTAEMQAPKLTAEHQWWLGDIAEGIVWVEEASREAWVPQFIDWHIHEGISFRKGCYTGQEIVARLQYLGKSKKNLVAVSTVADANIAIMTALQDSQGKTLGDIAAWCGRLGLAVMNSDWPESGIKAG